MIIGFGMRLFRGTVTFLASPLPSCKSKPILIYSLGRQRVDKGETLSFYSGQWKPSINFFICMYEEQQQVAYPAFVCSQEYSTHCAASQTFIPIWMVIGLWLMRSECIGSWRPGLVKIGWIIRFMSVISYISSGLNM